MSSAETTRRDFIRSAVGAGVGLSLPLGAEATAARETAPDAAEAVALALRHILHYGYSNTTPPAFELDLLRADRAVQEQLADAALAWLNDPSAAPSVSRADVFVAPKRQPSETRTYALLDPLDALRYLAAAILTAQTTERCRLPVSALRVFSHRFSPSGARLFADDGYPAFDAEVSRRIAESGACWLAQADIANCYGSLRPDDIHRALTACGVTPSLVTAVASMLEAWQGDLSGLPVGTPASHILAEAAFIGIDSELTARGVDFIRYVDDYRMFAPDEYSARRSLDTLASELDRLRLRLNPGKTFMRHVSGGAVRLAQQMPRPENEDEDEDKKPEQSDDRPPQQRPDAEPSDNMQQGYRQATIHWREPLTPDELNAFARVDIDATLSKLSSADAVDFSDFCGLLEASRIQRRGDLLPSVLAVTERAPWCLPYLGEFLMQEEQSIPPEIQRMVSRRLAARLRGGQNLHEYVVVAIVRLLGHGGYADASVHDYVTQSPVPSDTVLRIALDSLSNHLSRADALALYSRFGNARAFIGRSAVRLAAPYLSAAQRSALARQDGQDPFIAALMRSSDSA